MDRIPLNTIHGLIEARAQMHPGARAVVHEGNALTYAELELRANQLAHYLVERGVGPDVLVGIHMERSLELVVSMLAVLKAGGAYLPLDPNYPDDRNAFMLADAKAAAVITDRPLRATFAGPRIDVVTERDAIAQQPRGPVERAVDPANMAYVIYTSGSTGRPKGVMIPHTNVVRLMTATEPWFHFDHDDVWTFFHSYAFDFSVWEIWGALIYGGSVVVVSDATRQSPDDLLALLRRERVTVLNQIPSAFRHLIASATQTADTVPLSLRYVIFGGEALELRGLVPWFERYPSRPTLVNMYGITETTVHVTYRVIDPAECAAPSGSPIGVPIPDLEVHVLDASLAPVPVGAEGEVYVGGKGLARGYLARPSLTAERFVPDPFSGRAGDRLYKTGDLARRLADGGLEYLGRNDAQVKIRGHRIETGEIASILATHRAVREAAVVARDVGDGDRRLVAYVTLKATALSEDLTAFLSERLPAYMVPSLFVAVDAMPITPSGKLDLAALPAPDWSVKVDDTGTAPRTAHEVALAKLWCDVLRIRRVGIRDDFFELGGHSLLAVKLVAKIRVALSIEVTLGQLFANPTIEQLATEIMRARGEDRALAPIPTVPRDGVLPLAPAQERMWFVERMLRSDSARPLNTAFAVEIRGAVDVDTLSRALTALVERHEILRTNFKLAGKQLVQIIDAPFEISLAAEAQGQLIDEERDRRIGELATELARPAFDLAKDRLVRARFVTFGPGDQVLLLALHHIVYDGAAIRTLLAELAALYAGGTLAPLDLQYSDIAAWQRTALSPEETERQLAYWRERLDGAPFAEIPPDRPAPPVVRDVGAHTAIVISREHAAAVRELARAEATSPFVTILAGVVAIFAQRTQLDDIVLGTVVTNRDRPELERAVGPFLNVVALRVNAGGDPSFRQLVTRARAVVSEAFQHREVSFEKVTAALRKRPDRKRGLFQLAISVDAVPPVLDAPAGQTWSLSVRDTGAVLDELSMELLDDGTTIKGAFGYRTDLFDRATAEALCADLVGLLARGAAQPDLPISRLYGAGAGSPVDG